jgi:CheY-like chemotaxis protein
MCPPPLRLLYIDDTAFDRLMLERCLRSASLPGVTLETAATVEIGLQVLAVRMPDLLFLDNRIPPYRDFEQVLPLLRAAGYAGPIVLLTGLPTELMHQQLAEPGPVLAVLDKQHLAPQQLVDVLARVPRRTGPAGEGVIPS